jgi:ketosteroid isomerase-like protein
MRLSFLVLLLFAALSQSALSQHADPDTLKDEILRIHASDLAAVVRGDASDIASRLAPEIFSVDGGHIDRLTREELLRHVADSFNAAQHRAVEDLEPPVVHVSTDGTMAWAILRCRYGYDGTNPNGKVESASSTSASLVIYEKIDGKWLATASATTEEATN